LRRATGDPQGTTAAKGLAALPDGGTLFYWPPAIPFILPIPGIPISLIPKIPLIPATEAATAQGTTAAKGLAALPVGGITFYPCYPAYFQDICEK